jgi:hypothetical protein
MGIDELADLDRPQGVSSPAATAGKRLPEALERSATPSIAGSAKATGRSRRGGKSRSRQARIAAASPPIAISTALRMIALASPSSKASSISASSFSVVALRMPFGLPGLPAWKRRPTGGRRFGDPPFISSSAIAHPPEIGCHRSSSH